MRHHAGGEDPGRAPLARSDLALLVLCCLPICFWGLGRYGVVNADEAFYQAVAERMVATGDWLHLDFRGEPRFYDAFLNAPLPHWLRAALIALFGSNLWTMRVLSAAAGAGAVLATACLAARVAGPLVRLRAGLVLLTTFQFVYLHGARTGELDALVTLEFVAIAVLFLRGVEDGKSFVPHHLVLCALGWTKTPLVLVPLAAELFHFAQVPAARIHWRAYWRSGLALLPLALSWHLLQLVLWWERVPAILAQFLGQASGARADSEYHGRLDNLLFYLRALAWGGFPWSVVWPLALIAAWRAPRVRPLLAWPAALLVFFTLVAKHYAWYVLPAYPFLAIAVAAWLFDATRPAGARTIALAIGAIAAALLCVDAAAENPFGQVALTYSMEFRPRETLLPGLTAAALAGLLSAVVLRRGVERRHLALLMLWFVLVIAAAGRVLAPLRHLDHQPALDRLHAELAQARAEGRAIAYPVRLPEGSVQIARFWFAEDYEIEVRRGGRTNALWLHPKGDPAVLERSIGRLGLERRLTR